MAARSSTGALTRRGFIALGSVLALPVRPAAAEAEAGDPALDRLINAVQPMLRDFDQWVTARGGKLHACVADARARSELLGVRSDIPENPASNQKLVTAGAALYYLGAGFTYVTGLYGEVQGSSVQRLVIRGQGDPSLSSRDLEAMVDGLKKKGIKQVGDIMVDQSAFDDTYVPPAFEQRPSEWSAFRAPVSAVAVDGNATTFCARATKVGEPAQIWFEPPGFVQINGDVATVAKGKKVHPGLTLSGSGQKLSAKVAGAVPEGARSIRWRMRVEDPRWYAGYVLRRLLLNKGIAVKGDVKLGGSDEREELVVHRSRPLSELLHQLGKKSDNFYAEMLLKTIGLKRKGAPARSAAGAEATVAWLKKVGAWDPGSRIENGSGLYDANRLSPRTITRFLAQMLRDPKLSVDFLDQLAVGGIDGTLAGRFYSLKSQRSVLAKTGTLRRIASLSGYVFGPDRQKAVSFSFIVADAPGRHAQSRKRIDAIVTTIAKELWKSA